MCNLCTPSILLYTSLTTGNASAYFDNICKVECPPLNATFELCYLDYNSKRAFGGRTFYYRVRNIVNGCVWDGPPTTFPCRTPIPPFALNPSDDTCYDDRGCPPGCSACLPFYPEQCTLCDESATLQLTNVTTRSGNCIFNYCVEQFGRDCTTCSPDHVLRPTLEGQRCLAAALEV